MGNISITQELQTLKEINQHDLDWEQEVYQAHCANARQDAENRLAVLEEQLFRHHSSAWKIEGFRSRTIATRFGEVRIRRRLYRDEKGKYHFLLDEYLHWPPGQTATPGLQESLIELATQTPFRQVSKTLSKLTASVLSTGTIYQLLEKAAKKANGKEKEEWQNLYERGELPPGGERKVSILFSEGDGTFIHLQREKQKDYEIKQAIGYEGWEKLSGKEERYKLTGKRFYCHANEEIPFWEGVSLEWSRNWDLSYPMQIVIGGDGANWIDKGLEEFARSVRQLDGFHLARACGRGWEEGKVIYEAIRAGEVEKARDLINNSVPRQGSGVEKSRRYVTRNIEKGKDWRTVSGMEGRALGTMESNEDKLVANRMKKRGLSWTIEGALRMNKAIQLAANGEIKPFCEREEETEERISMPVTSQSRNDDQHKWLDAGLPALYGPHASRFWVQKLRLLVNCSCRLN